MLKTDQRLYSAESEPKTLLIVDYSEESLRFLSHLLEPDYRVITANTSQRALAIALTKPRPDLILLNITMPEIDGYQAIQQLKADAITSDIPVIFVTDTSASVDEARGLALGAVDYIIKPFSPSMVKNRVHTQLELKLARDYLNNQKRQQKDESARRIAEIQRIRDLSVRALACLAEVRDKATGLHILRTQSYIEILGRELLHHPLFAASLNDGRLDEIIRAAPLHDIGKIGIPDSILLKPGKLTDDEFEVMKTHSAIGGEAIQTAIDQIVAVAGEEAGPDAFDFLKVASEIAYCHHEKWDGSGYPAGLKGNEIPVSARLMALADVFDALSCCRVYKAPYSIEETIDIIIEGRGSHFDPDVVDAFTRCCEQFISVAKNLADHEALSEAYLIQPPFLNT